MPRECLAIIESKSKVRYSRNKPVVAKVRTNTSTSGISPDVAELKDMVKALLLDKKINYNQGNASYRPPMMSNQIRPPGFPPIPNNQNVQLRNNQNHFNQNQNRGNNFNHGPVYQPSVFQPPAYQAPAYQALAPQTQSVLKEDFSAYIKANDAVIRNIQTQGQNIQNQLTNLTDLLNKFMNSNGASTSSSGTLPSKTIANSRKATKNTVTPPNNESTEDMQPPVVRTQSPILTSEPVNSPIIEHLASPVIAPRPNQRPSIPYPSILQDQKLCDKANDQREKFFRIFKDLNFNISFADALILMPKKAECLAMADLGASINLMPLSLWNKLSLPDLTPTCITLELANRLISRPVGVAEDVYVKGGTFHFSADFVVVDFDADPRVPLVLERSFLKTERVLIDLFEGELTLLVGKEAITFNLDQTSRYSANYSDLLTWLVRSIRRKFWVFLIDFLLEEVDAFLALEDDPTSPEELKNCEAKSNKSSIDEPLEVELKDLTPYLEYVFLEGGDKFPVIIAWKLSNIKGINPEFCTNKILMEEDFEPAVQHQRRVNLKIHYVIKQEVLKLDAGMIYLISDSPWVSPVHCVPKKGSFTVVENEENELIPTRLVTGWRVCIDYHNTVRVNQKVIIFLIESSIHILDQNRYPVDTSFIPLESRKSPTVELFDVDSGRISILHYEYQRVSL
nr:putative reverse transcriptase domain-containing protein [Tanacetum cinerariifolium]